MWRRAAPAVPFVVCAAAVAVLAPPILYQINHCFLGYHDVGNYSRALFLVFTFGRLAVFSDGSGDFLADQHFKPFLFLLSPVVRLFGTMGFVAAISAALVAAAGYAAALGTAVTKSPAAGLLCGLAFVANPYTYAVALSYHVETYAILGLLALAYHAHRDQPRSAWIALVLVLTVKEDMWVYAAVTALLVARRDRPWRTVAFVIAAVAYDLVVVGAIGSRLYPTAHYLNAFYGVDGHTPTRGEIVLLLLGRWREFVSLLFSGPGLAFQASVLLLVAFSPMRYVMLCAVTLLWLTYPGGPPRSTLGFYYSYAVLALSFVALPFALVKIQTLLSRVTPIKGHRTYALAAVMSVLIGVDIAMHSSRWVPDAIRSVVDPRVVFGAGPRVRADVVRALIRMHLVEDRRSVLAQHFTFAAIPQRAEIYVTLFDRARVLDGSLEPHFVLIDRGADDPGVPPDDVARLVTMLRQADRYRPLHDDGVVLLYERR